MADRQPQDTKRPPTTKKAGPGGSPKGGYSLLPNRIPAPLQRLFDRFPLVTYPANDLPARCPPRGRGVPTLHIFISEEDATRGRPSFNPSCLKWQTFLRIAGVQVQIVPSTNHASPTGSLPFLLPGRDGSSTRTSTFATATSPPQAPASDRLSPLPIPAHKLHAYALAHNSSSSRPPPSSSTPPPPSHEAYQSLLDHAVRRAWLHALYLTDANAPLLEALYLRPASRSAGVRRVLRAQLRRAAAAELAGTFNGVDVPPSDVLYQEAREALGSLAALLEGGEEGKEAPWFFGATAAAADGCGGARAPSLFDAAVFAYTHLLLDKASGGLAWVDRTLADMVASQPALVRHRDAMLELLWGEGGRAGEGADLGESSAWEKL